MEYRPQVMAAYDCAYAANDTYNRIVRLQAIVDEQAPNTQLPAGETLERIQLQLNRSQQEFAQLQDMAGVYFCSVDQYPQPTQAERPIFDYGNPERSLDELRAYCVWREISPSAIGNYVQLIRGHFSTPEQRESDVFSADKLQEEVRKWATHQRGPHGIGPRVVAFCADYLNVAYLAEDDQIDFKYEQEEGPVFIDMDAGMFAEMHMPGTVRVGAEFVTAVTVQALADYGGDVVRAGRALPHAGILSAIAKRAKAPIPFDHKPAVVSDDIIYLGKRRRGQGQDWGISPQAFITALLEQRDTLEVGDHGNNKKALEVARRYAEDLQRALAAQDTDVTP